MCSCITQWCADCRNASLLCTKFLSQDGKNERVFSNAPHDAEIHDATDGLVSWAIIVDVL